MKPETRKRREEARRRALVRARYMSELRLDDLIRRRDENLPSVRVLAHLAALPKPPRRTR